MSPPVVNVVGGDVGDAAAAADGAAGWEILVLAVPTAAKATKPKAAIVAERNFISNAWERLALCFVVCCRDGYVWRLGAAAGYRLGWRLAAEDFVHFDFGSD